MIPVHTVRLNVTLFLTYLPRPVASDVQRFILWRILTVGST